MRKGLLIGVALATFVAVVVALGLSVLWRGATHTELPVAAVLPQHTAYYVEARDLRGLVKGVRTTQAWQDLQASGLIDREGAFASFAQDLEEVSEKIGYPLNEDNAMKLLGDEAALAVWIDGEGVPHQTLVTRIDAEALAVDLLDGDLDWRELQAEINRRVEQAEVTVASEEYGGYLISSASKGETTVHMTLLEDLLVVADTRDGVATAVDLRVAEGVASLDALPGFREELARLPEGAPLREWIHVAELRSTKLKLPNRKDRPMDLSPMLAGIKSESVARAMEMPGSDMYRMDWTWSRSGGELFADDASPDLRATMPPDALVHVELHRIGQLGAAWEASPIKAHLAGSWAERKLDELMDQAEDKLKDATLEKAAEGLPDLSSSEFVRRFGWNVIRRSIAHTLGSEAAFAVWTGDRPDDPSVMVALRLDTDGRMLELMARGVLADDPDRADVLSLPHGKRTIRSVGEAALDDDVYWVTAGDLFLFTNDVERLRTALDRADGIAQDKRDTVSAAMQGLPEGHRMLMVVSGEQYRELGAQAVGPGAEAEGMLRLMQDSVWYDAAAVAVYAADDLSQVDVRIRAPMGAHGRDFLRPWYDVARGAPRALDVLPDNGIWTYAARVDLSAGLQSMRDREYGEISEAVEGAIAGVEESMEIDITGQLIPALGDEVAMSVLFRETPDQPGEPPVPGIALLLDIDDQAPVIDLLDKLSAMAREESARDAATPDFAREDRKGAPVWRVVQKPLHRDVPFDPTVAILGDFLVLSLDDSTVDDMFALRDGTRRSHAASDFGTRVRASGLAVDGSEFHRLDWDLLLDQIALYAPQLAELFVDEDALPMPEFPDDGDMEEWQRRMEAYQKARAEAAETKVADVMGAIDSLRFIDFMASASSWEKDHISAHGIVRFKR